MSRNAVLRVVLGENVLAWTSNMQFVNKDEVYFKICFEVFGDGRSISSELITPTESAWRRPDLLEFTAGSDVSIVVKHEI